MSLVCLTLHPCMANLATHQFLIPPPAQTIHCVHTKYVALRRISKLWATHLRGTFGTIVCQTSIHPEQTGVVRANTEAGGECL